MARKKVKAGSKKVKKSSAADVEKKIGLKISRHKNVMFPISAAHPVDLGSMSVINYIPGKKARDHTVVVKKKKGKGKNAEDEIVRELYN